MMIEDVNIPGEDAREIIYGDESDFKIVQDEMIDHSRWSILHRLIVQRVSDGLFFESTYRVGATESQDESPWEYGDAVFVHVLPVEKTVVVYEHPSE